MSFRVNGGAGTVLNEAFVHEGISDTYLSVYLDTNKAFLTIARNLYKQDTDGIYPASNLADVLSELNRTQPGVGGPLAGDDYKTILSEVKGFLIDDQRGFTRFLNIVKARGPH